MPHSITDNGNIRTHQNLYKTKNNKGSIILTNICQIELFLFFEQFADH